MHVHVFTDTRMRSGTWSGDSGACCELWLIYILKQASCFLYTIIFELNRPWADHPADLRSIIAENINTSPENCPEPFMLV